MVSLDNHLAVIIVDGLTGVSPGNALFQALNHFLAVRECFDPHPWKLLQPLRTICLTDNLLLGYIDKSSGQITGVRCAQRGIGETFARTVRGDKVFEYVKPLTEICLDRQLDGLSGGICHQSAHSGKLLDLLFRTTRTGVRHHINIVVLVKPGEKLVCDLIVRFLPSFNYRLVTLLLGH